MTRPASRLLASLTRTTTYVSSFAQLPARQCTYRAFSQTCFRRADDPPNGEGQQPPARQPSVPQAERPVPSAPADTGDIMNSLGALINDGGDRGISAASETMARATGGRAAPSLLASSSTRSAASMNQAGTSGAGGQDSILGQPSPEDEVAAAGGEPYHMHIYSTKRNCHITLSKPNRDCILSLSSGNIGFRKAKRGTYDAAFQLMIYTLDKMHQNNWHRKIRALEVVLRGWGQGREAASKVLLGTEARLIRPLISKVSDDTKIKFGGTRPSRSIKR